jgi:hypothetical protein
VVDVTVETVVERPRGEVAAYASDPDNAPEWYANIRQVEWLTEPPLATGTRLRFVARFLGRRLAYTYEVATFEPGRSLTMRTTDGPFPMETTYAWADAAGGTRMVLGNRGGPRGLARLASPLMALAVRAANRKDLARLKEILERADRPR